MGHVEFLVVALVVLAQGTTCSIDTDCPQITGNGDYCQFPKVCGHNSLCVPCSSYACRVCAATPDKALELAHPGRNSAPSTYSVVVCDELMAELRQDPITCLWVQRRGET
jgi:hypothetical protein